MDNILTLVSDLEEHVAMDDISELLEELAANLTGEGESEGVWAGAECMIVAVLVDGVTDYIHTDLDPSALITIMEIIKQREVMELEGFVE